jgi:pilus assembly protein CpaC
MPRPAAFGTVLAAVALLSATSARPAVAQLRGSVALEAGQGRVMTLAEPAANVFVGDPKVAEVRPAGPTSLFIFGVGPGRTTVAALTAEGRSVAVYDVTTSVSSLPAGEAAGAVRRIPGEAVQYRETPAGITMEGAVDTADQAQRASHDARAQLPPTQSVQNLTRTRSGTQVTLQVRIAEMSRSVTREFGVNWNALGAIGRYAVGFATANPFPVTTGLASAASSYAGRGAVIDTVLNALAQDNLARMLAEPNLTATSGEAASFLVGGEFPVPVAQQQNTITVEFKQYGVGLTFVPTVFDGARINLHLRTEVSALSQNGAVQLSAGNSTISIPGLTVQRAETSVELGSGQSIAIAGLLQDQVTQTTGAVPWLGEIPILGALFRSDAFQRSKTELVIIVTPVITRPQSDPQALAAPTDAYVPPTDAERVLLMRQTGAGAPAPVSMRLPGQAGFIVQ